MCRSSKSILPIAVFCIFASRLPGEPIALTASSASVSGTFCVQNGDWCGANISATGPSFSLSGSPYLGTSSPALLGLSVPPTFFVPYPTSFAFSGTGFGPGGPIAGFGPRFVSGQFLESAVTYFGFATVDAVPFVLACPSPQTTAGCRDSSTITLTAGEINLPLTRTSPSANFVLPATMTGSFNACETGTVSIQALFCLAPPLGNVSMNLPGDLFVTVSATFPSFLPGVGTIQVSESFASTPVPEPATLLLMGGGVALIFAVGFRRKSGSTVLAALHS